RRHRQIRSIWGVERSILVEVVRKRITAREARPWIVQIDAGLNNRQTEWRDRRGIQVQILFDEVVRDSTAKTDCSLPASCRIPGQRETWIEVLVVRLNARFAVESRIAGIRETRRSARNHSAFLAGIKSRQAEIVKISLRKRHWEEWFPAQAVG